MAISNPPPWAPPSELVSRHPALRHLLSCNSMPHFLQIHALSITTGAAGDNLAAARILSFPALSPTGSIPYARRLFAANPKADAFMANILLRAYASFPDPNAALAFFAETLALSRLQRPDARTLALALKAAADASEFAFGKMVHGMALKLAEASDVSVQNFLVRLYASFGLIDSARLVFDGISNFNDASRNIMLGGYLNCGLLDDARQVFYELPDRRVISWSVMINGLVQNSQFREALDLFGEMLMEKVEPNESIYVNVLSACSHLGAVEQGRWVESYLHKDSAVTVRIGTALIDMYLKCGCVMEAFSIFNMMQEKNSLTWSAMITGLAINGYGEDSLSLFALMEVAGISPNEVTFVGVLNACSHSRLVDVGLKHFDSMMSVYRIQPNVQHYCCLVDLYGRAGFLEKAEEVIKNMPMQPNSAVWGSLLNACRIHSNAYLGEKVGKKLLELEPENSGRYVLLSNIYASKGMWKEVAELRRIMKERGVVKTPGSSCIDLKGEVHEFIAGDSFHPQKGEIYAMLEEMSNKLKLAGYKPRTEQVLIDMEEEEEKESSLYHHSEKLTLAFGLIGGEPGMTLRIMKNLRICDDCHLVMKMISKIYGREIVVRDRSRFHHLRDGACSCNDYW